MKPQKHFEFMQRLFVVLLTLLVSCTLSASVTHSLQFSADSLIFSSKSIENNVFTQINYNGLRSSGDEAMPTLPVDFFTVSVPYDAQNFSISVTVSGTELYAVPSVVSPGQAPRVFGDTTAIFTEPDSVVYNTDAFYPQNLCKIVGNGYLGGDNHLITIAVRPIQYNPVSAQIKIHENISVTLSYTVGGDVETLNPRPISRSDETLRNEVIEGIKEIVVNPEDVEGNSPAINTMAATYSFDEMVGYEYCIITSRELAPAFERLAAWKKQKGYAAGIVCIEDILAHTKFQNGDEISGINDDAGKLRQYLYYAYNNHGTKFVLLGGKEPHVPVRYGNGGENDTDCFYAIPTDMYFSDLNSNWNTDGDNFYGELSDSLDFSPEVYVGRLLCKNIEEVNNYIDKLLIYEMNPGGGDYSYLEKSLFYFSYSNYTAGNEVVVKEEAQELFSSYNAMTQTSHNYPMGNNFITELNRQYNGYIGLYGHGNPGEFVLTDVMNGIKTRYGISATDTLNRFLIDEDYNGLDCLSNQNHPSILYTTSCTTMPFDYFNENGYLYDIDINLGESFTLGKNYGGPAYLGNTRYGYYFPLSLSPRLSKHFLSELNERRTKIGVAEANSKSLVFHAEDFDQSQHYIRLSHNLLGDPEFDMWTKVPTTYNDAIVDVSHMSGGGLMVHVSDVDSCTIVVYDITGATYKQNKSISSSRFPNVSHNSVVTVYCPNTIPYIVPILWQNGTFRYPMYVYANTISIGRTVDGNNEYGDAVFANGANITVEASGEILVSTGCIVQSGAVVTLKTSDKAIINGGTVEVGGVLNIEAHEFEVIKSITNNGGTINLIEIN